MYRSRNTGRYIKPPTDCSVYTFGILFVLMAVVLVYTIGYTIGDTLAVRAESREIVSPIPADYTASPTPSNTPTPSPVQVTPVESVTVRDGSDWTVEQVKDYIRTKDWTVEDALRIAMCESGYRADAIGDVNLPDGGPVSVGVFQIRAFPNRPSVAELMDYVVNIDWAYGMWKVQGWQPWTCK